MKKAKLTGTLIAVSAAVLVSTMSAPAMAAAGIQSVGNVAMSTPFSISADGSTVVGTSTSSNEYQVFRWTESDGMIGLGSLLVGSSYSNASAVSADGPVIVGWNHSASAGYEPFRWTQDSGMVGLSLSVGSSEVVANGASADGAVIVGDYDNNGFSRAFRWTQSSGMIDLGTLGSSTSSSSYAITASADGSVIVGWRMADSTGGQEAFLWTAADGMRSLQDVLAADFGFDMTGWDLQKATGISADGKTIVGTDCDSSAGNCAGWIVTLPEPTTVMLLAFGSFAVLKRKG